MHGYVIVGSGVISSNDEGYSLSKSTNPTDYDIITKFINEID